MSNQERQTPRIRRMGRLLILAGVAVWAPYVALAVAGEEPEVMYFLPFHLSGVISGAIMSRWQQVKRLVGRS